MYSADTITRKQVFYHRLDFFFFFSSPGFHKVMEGIDKAIELGYNPVKVFPSSVSGVFWYDGRDSKNAKGSTHLVPSVLCCHL